MDHEREDLEESEKKSRIEEAQARLYAPDAPKITYKRNDSGRLPEEEEENPVLKEWQSVPRKPTPINTERIAAGVNSVFKKILIGAIVFFVLCLIAAGTIYYYGNNTISSKNIDLQVNAPASVPSSDTYSFDVTVQNGNNADLIQSDIIVDYPDGTRSLDDTSKPLVSEKDDIGTLHKGDVAKKTVSARLFGQENDVKTIKVTYEYMIAGSNAHFSKETSFDVKLRLAPVVLSVDALSEVNSNQEVTLTANIISNSSNTLNNVALDVIYPFGFTYESANLEVQSGQDGLFPIGDLQPNETKQVVIKGIISGQSAEDKTFKFDVGTADPSAPEKVTTSLTTYQQQMSIRSDFLATSISFDGTSQQYTQAGQAIHGTINWKNTLSVPINDAQFVLKVGGDLIIPQNISADQGYYDSSKSTATWNKSVSDTLGEITPGETGQFSFSIPLQTYDQAISSGLTNPKVNLSLDVSGLRINENNVTESIESSFTKTVPIETTVDFQGNSLYSSGPIKNTGPIPPQAEKKTTYTISLALKNSVNDVSDGEVTAILPLYVNYENLIFPETEKVVWNQGTRQMRWEVGSLPAQTGYGSDARTLSFQVSITPSKTQIGQAVDLVKNIQFTGHDDYASADISQSIGTVQTTTADPGVVSNNGQVVQ
jgi:hypothetical protein